MGEEPDLLAQTMALGKLLMLVSDRDPDGIPSAEAIQAFTNWLAAAGPTSREPRYFADIAQNYDIAANSNQDLFKVFDLLNPYIQAPEDDADSDDNQPPRAFLGLPVVR